MKFLNLCLIIAIIICVFFPGNSAALVSDSSKTVDFVIVFDDSGSMRYSDPDRFSLDAANMFIDLLPAHNANVSIIVYGKTAKTVVPLTDAGPADNKESIKKALKNSITYNQRSTDYCTALQQAVSILDDSASAKAAILLFTDGNLEVTGASKEAAGENLENAIDSCRQEGRPIYTVGLNFDGSVDSDMLKFISYETNAGESLITERPEALSTFFCEILKRYYENISPRETIEAAGSTASYQTSVPLMVDETSIVINGIGTGVIESVTDPKGNVIDFDGDTFRLSKGENYIIIKLVEPVFGSWTVNISNLDPAQDAVSIQSLHVADLTAVLEMPKDDLFIGQPLLFKSYLLYHDSIVEGAAAYGLAECNISIKDLADGQTVIYPAEVSDSGFKAEVVFETAGRYSVIANITTPDYTRTSESYEIKVDNRIPVVIKEFDELELSVGEDMDFALSAYFNDPDGLPMIFETQNSNEEILDAYMKDDTLYLAATGKTGEASVDISATDSGGETVSQTLSVIISNNPPAAAEQIGNLVLAVGMKKAIDLDEYFNDPDGLPLVFELTVDNEQGISAERTENLLRIAGVEPGTCNIRITAADSAGEKASMTVTVAVKTVPGYWWSKLWYIFVIILVLVVALLFIRRRVKGSLEVQVQLDGRWLPSYHISTGNKYVQKKELNKYRFSLKPVLEVYSAPIHWINKMQMPDLNETYNTERVVITGSVAAKRIKLETKDDIYLLYTNKRGKENRVQSCRLKKNGSVIVLLDEGSNIKVKLIYHPDKPGTGNLLIKPELQDDK